MGQNNQIGVENIQNSNIPTDINNKKTTKKGVFVAGIVFFALVLLVFVVTCCLKGYILGLAGSATTPDEGLGVGIALVVFVAISPFILFPMLAFFITSVVLLALSIKSCVRKTRISSIVCLCVDVAVFVLTIILLLVWIM